MLSHREMHGEVGSGRSPGSTRVVRSSVIATVVLLLGAVGASAQDVTEPALKAAYIHNFARFTEWPVTALPAAAPLVVCVLGDAAVSDALVRAVGGHDLAGHRITVSRVTETGPLRACHLLYVSGVGSGQMAGLVEALRDAPVLTISDHDGFIRAGGIAQFFFERGRLRFSVHLESAKRAGLHISSRLLSLARQP